MSQLAQVRSRRHPRRGAARSAGRVARVAASAPLAARFAGALALMAVGAVHLQQYVDLYSSIPTIGTLFLLNFAGATVLALVLLSRVVGWASRWGGALVTLAALGGVALAATSFVFLAVSEHTALFGFHEPGYDPMAIAVSRVAEVAAVVLLAGYLLARFVARTPTRRW
jgi:hypothetical protein